MGCKEEMWKPGWRVGFPKVGRGGHPRLRREGLDKIISARRGEPPSLSSSERNLTLVCACVCVLVCVRLSYESVCMVCESRGVTVCVGMNLCEGICKYLAVRK